MSYFIAKEILKRNSVKIILFIFILLLCYYRSPYIFLNGRFVAEEGSFFFYNTFTHGFLFGLTQIYIESSYMNLWANLSSIFAALVPLEYAPLITVYFAFIPKILLIIYILFQKSILITREYQKYLFSIIVIVSPVMVAELWLNTLVSQVYFTIISILIFFENEDKKFFLFLSPIVLSISSLSSIPACLLTIFFIIRYIKNNSLKKYYFLTPLVFGSAIQFLIFTYAHFYGLEGHGAQERFVISYNKLISFIYNIVVKAFLGRDLTQYIFNDIFKSNITIVFILLFFGLVIFLIFIKKNFNYIFKDKILNYIFILFLLQSLLAYLGSKSDAVYGRYTSIPGILLYLLIFRLEYLTKNKAKILFSFLIFLSVSVGLYEFKENNKYSNFFICNDCPDWKQEVNKWKLDKNYNLKIWQYPNKSMSLK